MALEDADVDTDALPVPRRRGRLFGRLLGRVLLAVLVLLLAALLVAWLQRFRIADDLLAKELAARGIEARYRIEEISPTRQVLTDVVIGDPAAPDLTIARLVVGIAPRLGFPRVTRVRLVRPELHASLRDGQLSFGALDPLIFTASEEPFELPDLVLEVESGRGRLESDFGRIGLGLAGRGNLRSGFAGALAATAPALAGQGCAIGRTTLRGKVTIDAGRPRLAGPLRFAGLACADAGLSLARGSADLDVSADRALKGVDGEAELAFGPFALADVRLAGLAGDTAFTWRDQALTARYTLGGKGFASAQASAATIGSEGLLRGRDNFARVDLEAELTGSGIALGPAADGALASAEAAGEGTLVAPLVGRIRRQLAREVRGASLAAQFTARATGERRALTIAQAALTGASGARLVALSRGQMVYAAPGALPYLAGDFTTGGEGLPQIVGQAERSPSGNTQMRLAMAEYAAGDARIALPALELRQAADGTLGIAGRVLASGPLPGGAVRDLDLPLAGRWSRAGGLAMWPGCTEVRFSALQLANLALDRDALTLCPPVGSAILTADERGLKIAAGAASLDLAGRIGETPVTIASGAVGFAWPGTLTARSVQVALGPPATASHFTISDLTANLGHDIAGHFDGADIRLASVPLDLLGASGTWRYAEGKLALAEGAFTLADRQQTAPRFRPLAVSGATLALADNVITADAVLREPRTGAEVSQVTLRHDLATAAGHADLAVPGITFGENLQPTDLTDLALGVVALVDSTVTGSGRIDWDQAGNVTSTGRFSSEKLDFAAAFGPVEGASGTVEFIDLIGLTTAPGQHIAIKTVNPGIEIYDGDVAFRLRGGEFIDVESARWPFLGGTLAIRPLTLTIGAAEQRGYILDIQGLEAAKFIERLQLDNLAATGRLDGTIPVIFDKDGHGRLEGGTLVSRPPGGNVAYVGALTYEDMGAITNFAFDALRSLDYREMRIGMNGSLTGELVTKVELEGVRQGADIKQNFITRRLAKLPIRLVVNVRAPFYRLIGSLRSLYDPSAVRDPRELGLVGASGEALRRETDQAEVEARDAATAAAKPSTEPDIQPTESGSVP